jgi:hypothetical protein
MSIVVRPATLARFGDVATMLGPKNPDSSVCWCLSHRLDSKTNRALGVRTQISPAPAHRHRRPAAHTRG